MSITPIGDYAQLLEKLERLPELGPDRVRVFRGQMGKHSQMLPSGLRSGGAYRRSIWQSYMRTIALGMPGASGQVFDAPLYGLWIEAIAQHYGTGSRFLDVTTDIDVALWFALNQAEAEIIWEKAETATPVVERVRFGVQGFVEAPVAHSTLRYSTRKGQRGWLYVFDVPKWNGREEPAHGFLIDLAEAPPLLEFQSSKRMIVQSACLLSADARRDNGDLAKFCQGDPIPVRWPLAGNDSLKKTAADVFPDPSEDPWYALFLSIPFCVRPGGHGQLIEDLEHGEGWVQPVNTHWTRPLPVTVYLPASQEKSKSSNDKPIAAFNNLLDPPFVYSSKLAERSAATETNARFIDETSAAARKYRLDEATVIMLESPLISMLPPLDLWNHGLLHVDLAEHTESAAARELPDGPIVMEEGRAVVKLTKKQRAEFSRLISTPFSLTNVFLELSPLEKIKWEKIGDQGVTVLRALWLRHNRKRFVLSLYYQLFPLGPRTSGLSEEGPYFFVFDEGAEQFSVAISENESWRWEEVSESHPAGRPLFGALSLLRALSPGPGLQIKADPVHSGAKKEADQWEFRVALRSRAAQLGHGLYLPDGRQILSVLGHEKSLHEGWLSNEPYDLFSAPVYDYIKFETKDPWNRVDARSIRQWIDENLSYKV